MHVDFAEQLVKPPSTIAETRITNAHNVPHRLYRRASHGRDIGINFLAISWAIFFSLKQVHLKFTCSIRFLES